MKKIMFNDKYGLTKAVFLERKTQTRRIVKDKEMINLIKEYDTPSSFLSIYERFMLNPILRSRFIKNSKVMRYQENETVAIAQSYADIVCCADWVKCITLKKEKGWSNKMFVRAEDMPHHILITKIRIEKLQDISDEDCLKEGICRSDIKNTLWGVAPIRGEGESGTTYEHSVLGYGPWHLFPSVKKAYASLIDRISGKGTWENNPYVFVYDFELID